MAGGWVLFHAAVAIIGVILLIVRVKLNAAISLVIGALYLGLASGVAPDKTATAIAQGFGGLMTGIGLPIGFGVLLGTLTSETGAIQRIARSMLRAFGRERSSHALTATGVIVSTPVFYDVGYVILAPLARTLAAQTGQQLGLMGAALVFGLGIAHTFIPPTPGPLAGGELLKVPLGTTLAYGALVAVPTAFIGLWIYRRLFLDRGLWNPATDEETG